MRRRRLAVVTLAAAVLALNACDTDDGREMQSPDSMARFRLENTTTSTSTTVAPPPTEFIPATSSTSTSTTTSTSSTSTSSTSSTAPPSGALVSPAESSPVTAAGAGAELQFAGPWDDGEAIPVEFTCDGASAEPLITWAAPPEGTAELAVSVIDTDADGYVHWLVIGLPAEAGSVGGGEPLVTGAAEGLNSSGGPGWAAPCPDPADTPHSYQFTLHVLDQATELPPDSPTADLLAAVDAATAKTATFTGTYERA